jgi:regulator of sigma E protease
MGIQVEAFSIGWGKPILKKKIGDVEYRLGLFPLGGYCKMKGESVRKNCKWLKAGRRFLPCGQPSGKNPCMFCRPVF